MADNFVEFSRKLSMDLVTMAVDRCIEIDAPPPVVYACLAAALVSFSRVLGQTDETIIAIVRHTMDSMPGRKVAD